MRLNKKTQYGMLFVLYLCRSGRTTIEHASKTLKLSQPFLEQVARRLRQAGVIESVRGPGGGYELSGDPTVGAVINALAPIELLTASENREYRSGVAEKRALLAFVTTMHQGLAPLLKRNVRNLNNQLVSDELSHMERANEAAPV